MREIILFLDIVTFLITLGFGTYIFFVSAGQRLRFCFSTMMFGVTAWSLTLILIILGIGPIEPPGRLAFSFLAMFIAALDCFILQFPKPVAGAKYFKFVTLVLGVVFFFVPLLPAYVSDIVVINKSYISGNLSPVLFPLWSLYYIGALIYTLIFLLARTLSSRGVDRQRLRQLFVGFLFFLIGHITTQIALPLFMGDFRWNNLGPVWVLLLLPFMATAIFRYRLLDVRWIVSKSLAFTLIVAIVLWFSFAISYMFAQVISPVWSFLITAFIIAIILHPLSHTLERGINWIFARGSYDPIRVQDRILSVVRTQIDLGQIMRNLALELKSAFHVKEIAVVAFSPRGTMAQEVVVDGFTEDILDTVAPVYSHFRHHRDEIWETEELAWRLEYEPQSMDNKSEDRRIYQAFKAQGIAIAVPIVMENKLIALFLLGTRAYDRVLSSKDVWFLNVIRHSIAPAIANASRFAEMKELYSKLKETDALKSQFIETISHQFRTPLSSIRWNVETMLDKNNSLGQESKGILKEVEINSRFLVRTLNIFVDVIQYESGTMLVEKIPIETNALEEVFNKYHVQAKAKGINWYQKIEPGVFIGDQKELRKAVKEILRNSIEYTSAGGKIQARVVPVDGKIKIEISDNGIGISAKDQHRLFNKFYRSRDAVLAHPDGSGLGLYLANLIINKLGGSIEVESEVGKGTTVKIYLIAKKPLEIHRGAVKTKKGVTKR